MLLCHLPLPPASSSVDSKATVFFLLCLASFARSGSVVSIFMFCDLSIFIHFLGVDEGLGYVAWFCPVDTSP